MVEKIELKGQADVFLCYISLFFPKDELTRQSFTRPRLKYFSIEMDSGKAVQSVLADFSY
jgi:hypothetical protein